MSPQSRTLALEEPDELHETLVKFPEAHRISQKKKTDCVVFSFSEMSGVKPVADIEAILVRGSLSVSF